MKKFNKLDKDYRIKEILVYEGKELKKVSLPFLFEVKYLVKLVRLNPYGGTWIEKFNCFSKDEVNDLLSKYNISYDDLVDPGLEDLFKSSSEVDKIVEQILLGELA